MKRLLIFLAALLLMTGLAFGQSDPRRQLPTVIWAAQTATDTSSPYAVITAVAGHTLRVQVYSGGGAGSLSIEGTLDPQATVVADTADWTEIYSTTTLDEFVYVEDPPAYLRFVLTYTSGTIKVQIRGARLREITVTP